MLAELNEGGVNAVFHYVPLHSSPGGRRHGRTHGRLPVTDDASSRLIRLPLWAGMDHETADRVIDAVDAAVRGGRAAGGPQSEAVASSPTRRRSW